MSSSFQQDREINLKSFVIMCVVLFLTNIYPFYSFASDKQKKQEVIFHVPERNHKFIGRENYIKKISEEFKKSNVEAIYIKGLPGMGKTHLVKEYAYLNYKEYDVIWWVDCSISIEEQLMGLANELNNICANDEEKIPAASINPFVIVTVMKKALEHTDKKWLLIFDNLPKDFDVDKYFPNIKSAKNRSSKIICTTKYNKSGDNILKINQLSLRESVLLFENILGNEKKEERGAYEELSRFLRGVPLSIIHAASVIKKIPSLNAREYLKLYKNKKESLESLVKNMTDIGKTVDYSGSFPSALGVSLEELKKTSPISHECIQSLTFLSHKGITNKNILDWLKIKKYSEEKLHEITYNLVEFSFIEPIKSEEGILKYEMHQLTKEIIRGGIKRADRERILRDLVGIFMPYISEETYNVAKNISEEPFLLNHLKEITTCIEESSVDDPLYSVFLMHAFHAAKFYMNDLAFCEDIFTYIEKKSDEYNKIDEFVYARYLNTKGKQVFHHSLDQAISLTEKSVSILEKLGKNKKIEAEKFLSAVNNLVDYYLIQGRVKQAIEVCEKYKETLNFLENDLYNTIYHSFFALCRMYEGNYINALEHIESSISHIQKGGFSENLFIFVKVNKAEILARLNQIQECNDLVIPLKKDLFDIHQTSLNHLVIRTKIIEALLKLKNGDLQEAKEISETSLGEYEKILSNSQKDPIQGFARTILGDVYYRQEKFVEALKEYLLAREVYDSVFHIKEIDDLSDLYMKIIFACIKCQDFSLAKEHFKLQMDNFGLDHPRTLQIVRYLDEIKLPIPW